LRLLLLLRFLPLLRVLIGVRTLGLGQHVIQAGLDASDG
jgi:hypothetical protein